MLHININSDVLIEPKPFEFRLHWTICSSKHRERTHFIEALSFSRKCQHYSPNESNKAYDKTVSRKSGVVFEPRLVIEEVKSEALSRRSLKSKDEYLRQYIVVRVYLCQ